MKPNNIIIMGFVLSLITVSADVKSGKRKDFVWDTKKYINEYCLSKIAKIVKSWENLNNNDKIASFLETNILINGKKMVPLDYIMENIDSYTKNMSELNKIAAGNFENLCSISDENTRQFLENYASMHKSGRTIVEDIGKLEKIFLQIEKGRPIAKEGKIAEYIKYELSQNIRNKFKIRKKMFDAEAKEFRQTLNSTEIIYTKLLNEKLAEMYNPIIKSMQAVIPKFSFFASMK